ncbi:MAG: hypothetical protein ACFFEN_15090 [Candidatus Thorarchaeota archaeon]
MKKISYNLRIGIIGNVKYNKTIFIDSIKDFAIKSEISNEISEIKVVFKEIPINLKVFLSENLEEIVNNYAKIENLNVIIFTVNLLNLKSIEQYEKDLIDKFHEIYSFQGISILVGLNLKQILKNKISKKFKVSRFTLEDTAKYLNLIYCYEIYNKAEDIIELYNKILNDFLFRFRYSSPESFTHARIYGRNLLKEYNIPFRES